MRLPMRRLLVILLLISLPLQSSWAALGAYCSHEERGTAQQHLGHHQHQHKDDASGSGGSSTHSDCVFCHAGCAGLVSQTFTLERLAASKEFAARLQATSALPPARPERPNWARFA